MFETAIGQVFAIPFDDASFELTLTEAKLLKHYHPEVHERPPFTLVFRCPDPRVLPQSIYAMEHDLLGALEIFMVPIAGDAQGVSYEAVFN